MSAALRGALMTAAPSGAPPGPLAKASAVGDAPRVVAQRAEAPLPARQRVERRRHLRSRGKHG